MKVSWPGSISEAEVCGLNVGHHVVVVVVVVVILLDIPVCYFCVLFILLFILLSSLPLFTICILQKVNLLAATPDT